MLKMSEVKKVCPKCGKECTTPPEGIMYTCQHCGHLGHLRFFVVAEESAKQKGKSFMERLNDACVKNPEKMKKLLERLD